MTNLFCNVLVKFGEGAVEAAQGAIHKLAWKKSHATQQWKANRLRRLLYSPQGSPIDASAVVVAVPFASGQLELR